MEDVEQGSTYLNSCKVQLLHCNIKPHESGNNNTQNIDKVRLSFLEKELQVYESRLSAYDKSTSFILAQLQLINSWIESNFESQPLIDTTSVSYQKWMKSYNVDRIISIANQIKHVASEPRSNCVSVINQHDGRDNPQTPLISSDSTVEDKNVVLVRNELQEFEHAEEQMNETESQDLIEPGLLCVDSATRKETELESSPAIPEGSRSLLNVFSCPRCSMKFPKLYNLNRHMRTHTNERPYKCQQCNVKFKTKCHLNQHIKCTHTKGVKYKCNFCTKSLTRKDHLVEHELRHKGEKPHSCGTCEKKFVRKSERIEHEQIHLNKKSLMCTFCGATFRQKTNLKYHISIHTGEKPYGCSSCTKTFVTFSQLKSHQGVHEEEKPYKCNFCDKKYSSKNNKKNHERTHSDQLVFYNCTFCTYTFIRKYDWKRHVQTHTKEKPFKCEVCNKSFNTNEYLKKHGNIHTGEKPYNCKICGQRFKFMVRLDNHIKEVHSGKTYKCRFCNKILKFKLSFKKHMKRCQIKHNNKVNSK